MVGKARHPSQILAPPLYDKLNFNFLRDIAPVGGVMREPLVILVNPSGAVGAGAVASTALVQTAYAKTEKTKTPAKVPTAAETRATHRWRRRLLLDQHLVQLPEIAVVEPPARR
jgi:hypothetical protein